MVMMTKISLCSECAKDLNDANLFHLWEMICKRKGLYKRIYHLNYNDDPDPEEIRQLEIKGYIISTEISEMTIAIQPRKEYICTNDGENSLFYCAKPQLHLEACND
jgi:hypothetical protein